MRRWWVVVAVAAAAGAVALTATAQDGEEAITREICGACHDEADAFAAGPHGRAMAARSPEVLERSCVACHGPADEHIEDPMPENIRRLPGDEACASCHPAGSGRLMLASPAHRRHAVACLDCHASGHPPPGEEEAAEHLLTAAPVSLCGSCHRLQARAAELPFAHREGTRPFSCLNCHAVHGTARAGRLLVAESGGACLDCHTEKAGPWVFPHPPREVEGCVACHQPHGSPNPRLLTRRTVLNLCLECHAGVPAFHDLTQSRFRACLSCHSAVHGSHRDPRLFDE